MAEELPIPPDAVECIALALRHGYPHDGSDQDQAVDQEAEAALRAALEIMQRPTPRSELRRWAHTQGFCPICGQDVPPKESDA